jgi:hypothetical protein
MAKPQNQGDLVKFKKLDTAECSLHMVLSPNPSLRLIGLPA